MKHEQIFLPKNPIDILRDALEASYLVNIDELATKDNPSFAIRAPSKLNFEEAYKIINENSPHWLAIFRNESYFNFALKDHWEFGGCNIKTGDYGAVFIFIKVDPEKAEEIFKKHDLKNGTNQNGTL